ncbi:hypothetical protein C8F04DRAFT_1010575 [Mycena alexandri]|uniref:[Histone H3]-trimethyl-L-lysine(9) demethylase n=1 Tax=Mycena alexandri TaxID=1745969 RepID=A0AAD6WT72_9AGAR|nr:hypothetical protein C8F04DRAFT_1010575 [Mycena alexandri]
MSSVSSPLTASRSSSPEPPVQPDHFYGTDASLLPPSPDSEGKAFLSPDDDPLAHRGIPVFKPSMHEFADFEGYMTRVESWGRRSGIVKIIPPKEWTAALPDVVPQLATVKIKSPIEQFMRGRAGLFRQENMEKRKQMSVREWAELCAKPEFRAPGKDQVGLHNNPSAQPALRTRRKKAPSKPKPDPEADNAAMASPPNSASPDPEDTKPTTPAADADADPNDADTNPKKPQRNRRTERADKDASFLDSFAPHKDWLPPDTVATDYTPEFCAKLERAFWRNCGLGKPAWYGADTMGSLFTPSTTAWNVATLPSTLSRLLPLSSGGLPGVNTPYLYFGMWRATFAWHVEDMDLFSINYIHFGAPKFWYAVPQGRAGALEGTMRGYFPTDTSSCPQFLRHKSFLASPSLLSQSAVRPNHLVQHAGEFVVTFPRGYHAGFNLGLNCAESVNFALDSWLDEGRKAGVCGCVDYSVRIDVDQLLEDRRIDALELTDPAAAAHARALRDGLLPAGEGNLITTLDVEMPVVDPTPALASPSKAKSKSTPTKTMTPSTTQPRQTPRKRKPTAPFEPEGPAPKRPQTFPCCLCIAPSHTGLLRVHDLPLAWREVGVATEVHYPPSAGGKGVWMAHEGCAMVLPETWVDEVVVGGDGHTERVVFGVDGIERARWSLKCSTCTAPRAKSHGALIQCAKGKCPKAFHINCAKAGAEEGTGIAYKVVREVEKEVVLLEPAPASSGGAEPNLHVLKVIRKTEVDALCAQHNPVIVASRRASKAESLRADVLALPPLSRIKIRVSSGVFEVTLMRVLEDRCAVEVLWDAGEVREVKWANIVLGLGVGQIEYGVVPDTNQNIVRAQNVNAAAGPSGAGRAIAPYPPSPASTPYGAQGQGYVAQSHSQYPQQQNTLPPSSSSAAAAPRYSHTIHLPARAPPQQQQPVQGSAAAQYPHQHQQQQEVQVNSATASSQTQYAYQSTPAPTQHQQSSQQHQQQPHQAQAPNQQHNPSMQTQNPYSMYWSSAYGSYGAGKNGTYGGAAPANGASPPTTGTTTPNPNPYKSGAYGGAPLTANANTNNSGMSMMTNNSSTAGPSTNASAAVAQAAQHVPGGQGHGHYPSTAQYYNTGGAQPSPYYRSTAPGQGYYPSSAFQAQGNNAQGQAYGGRQQVTFTVQPQPQQAPQVQQSMFVGQQRPQSTFSVQQQQETQKSMPAFSVHPAQNTNPNPNPGASATPPDTATATATSTPASAPQAQPPMSTAPTTQAQPSIPIQIHVDVQPQPSLAAAPAVAA